MTKGRPLTNREKEFINAHKDEMFNSQIAVYLGQAFPEDNNGSRCSAAVRRYIKKEESDQG